MTQLLNPVMRYMNSWEVAPRKGPESTSTTNSSAGTKINKDFKPVVDQGIADLKAMYDSGALGQVADTSELQQMVFDRAEGSLDRGMEVMDSARSTYEDAMAGTGIFDPADTAALKQAAMDQARLEMGLQNDQVAKAGLLGSSRAAVMAGDREAQMANAFAQFDYDAHNLVQERAMWGADSMMNSGQGEAALLDAYLNIGNVQRDIEQEMLDADAKGLENYLAGMQVFTPLMTEQTSKSKTVQKQSGK